jgi:hypothetical protein
VAEELRPGFKAEAENIAQLVRAELGLGPLDALDCFALAETWGIPVVSLGELRENGAKDRSVRRLLSEDAGFSATTVVLGTKRLIVYNPRQPPGRSASSPSHELSHLILEHEAAPAIGIGGCRHWDGLQEAEADWLGATMLVPRERSRVDASGRRPRGRCAKLRRQRRVVPLARQPHRRRPAGRT